MLRYRRVVEVTTACVAAPGTHHRSCIPPSSISALLHERHVKEGPVIDCGHAAASLACFSPFPCCSSSLFCCRPYTSRRYETTGTHHTYHPGPIAKAFRAIVVAVTPTSLKKRMAKKLQSGLEQVEVMEKEAAWLRKHGSPLRVLGLPEHAEYDEVRERYRDLLFETHPDTGAIQSTDEFEMVKYAYQMIQNPNSLWYANGSGEHLLVEIQPPSSLIPLTKTEWFGVGSWTFGIAVAAFIVIYVIYAAWEALLKGFDPKFYRYMLERERDERRRREAGEEVDTDPVQYAPRKFKSLLFPGKLEAGVRPPT